MCGVRDGSSFVPPTRRDIKPISRLEVAADFWRWHFFFEVEIFSHVPTRRPWIHCVLAETKLFLSLALDDKDFFDIVMPIETLFTGWRAINLDVDGVFQQLVKIFCDRSELGMSFFSMTNQNGSSRIV